MNRFRLNGVTYYQEYRKCGKAGCRVCQRGPGHGPYWYSRDRLGHREYIGRQLPPSIEAARAAYRQKFEEMLEERGRLRLALTAIESHINGLGLSNDEKAALQGLGYGDTLA